MTSLPPNVFIKANNISVFSGKAEKILGSSKFNTTALGSAIVAVFDWWPTPSLQRLIAVTADGKVWRDTGSGSFSANTPIHTGLSTPTTDTHIVSGGQESAGRNKKLFILTGNSQIQIINGDGSTTANIANPATDWASGNYPTFGLLYQNRMVVLGSSADRHRLYFSFEEDHENFVGLPSDALANNVWDLWHTGGANSDQTANIQSGVAVSIFTTVNNDGFAIQSDTQFTKVTIHVTQAQTGAPVYTYKYWNGSSFQNLTLTGTPSYASTGDKILSFTLPTDWNTGNGGLAGLDNTRYTIQAIATTAPTTAVQSTLLTIQNTTITNFPPTFSIFPGEGDSIICAAVYRGLLFIFKKPFGVYILDGRDPDPVNWTISRYADAFGVASPHSTLQVLGDLIAANSIGSYTSLQASNAFGDFEAGDILANSQVEFYIRSLFNSAGLPYSQSIYYPERKVAYFSGASTSTGARDLILAVDVVRETSRISVITKDKPNCLALRKDSQGIQRPIYGAIDGFVYLMEQAEYNVAGAPYTGEFQTPYSDFSFAQPELAGKNKLFDWLEVNYVATGNNSFFCDVFVDGTFRQTISFSQFLGAELDSFILDVDKLAGEASGSRNRKPFQSCTGVRISLRFYNNVANEGFKIERAIIGFRISSEQLSDSQT